MELKIAQYFTIDSVSKDKRSDLVRQMDINYSIPDMHPGTGYMRKWAGYTSLHFAVKNYDVVLTNELLQKGADMVKQGTKDSCTPLHMAINTKYDYKWYDDLKNYKSRESQEITHSLVNTLLSRQVEVNNVLNPKDEHGISHLHIACIVNHAQAVDFFAKAQVDLDECIDDDADYFQGYTPLHCAIEHSSIEAAGVLLQHGADVNVANTNGASCVHLLVQRIMDLNDFIKMGKRMLCVQQEEELERLEFIAKLLLNATANDDKIFVDDTGLSALHVACTLKNKSVAEDLLKEDVDVNNSVKNDSKFWPGWTPLHFAACFSIEMMIILIESGANIMAKNAKGEIPLDLCAMRFTPVDVQLLLSTALNGFNDIMLSDNVTKLSDLLIFMNDYRKFSEFMSKLQNVNVTVPLDSPIWPGYTLLHICVILNEKSKLLEEFEEEFDLRESTNTVERYSCTEDEEILYGKRIELCLEYGCNVNIKNVDGQTPIHLAFNNVREAALELFFIQSKSDQVDPNGLSHFQIACILGNVGAVKRYLRRGADVNYRVNVSFDWHKRRYEKWEETKSPKNVRANSTPLHLAVQFNHEDIVEHLLANYANVYARDSMGFTPIHLAMCPVQSNLARMLFRATPNLRDAAVRSIGLSHLHVAACVDDEKAVDKLLLNGAQVDRVIYEDANKRIPSLDYYAGKTPLLVTSSNATVKSLLEAGADMDFKDPEGISALQHALRDMSDEPIEEYFRAVKSGKGDVESCGMTLLHVACGKFDIEWAEELLINGADVNARISDEMKKGATPLHVLLEEACILDFSDTQEFVDMVELLVSKGADVTIECEGSTPLHWIFEKYNLDDSIMTLDGVFLSRAVDLLLKSLKSYNVNPVNYQGFSHFHLACATDDVVTVRKFLDHGVDVNASMDPLDLESYGFTPLHFAMAHRCKKVTYLLLERGANLNAEDSAGNTPLHLAIKRKFVDLPLIEVMIRRGADVHAKNVRGETLLYLLWRYGGLTVDNLEFFWNHGCFINILDTMNSFSQSQ